MCIRSKRTSLGIARLACRRVPELEELNYKIWNEFTQCLLDALHQYNIPPSNRSKTLERLDCISESSRVPPEVEWRSKWLQLPLQKKAFAQLEHLGES